ncbi:BA14K family protein [Pseudohoeflea suaedae]|uniref:Lectin-like protein BA14k n=1 Tax=Pseudohoeflea suaedae TaxID=877384 RepID=A0A4R5PHG6_9HYPH|nr:BA14K family protein [Pseudohoeflea suaedae]TDH34350.1 BA14K family protein [Pseudohoeflea suaedae]
MKRFGKFLALLAVSASTVVAIPAAPAFAGGDGAGYSQKYLQKRDWHKNGKRYYSSRHYRHRPYYHHHHNNNGNAAAALGLGLAIGAVTAGAIASSRAPAPAYYGGGLEPWSPGWYRYCEDKYRSFNARTGTYRGYDGRDHFCNAP